MTDLPTTTLRSGGAVATIAHFGAHVLRFVPENGDDLLWVSREAVLDGSKAIRGGIPVCWPWFADHPTDPDLPAHGVARTRTWELESATGDSATLRLEDDAETHALWPHAFELRLHASLTPRSLEVVLEAQNPGPTPVSTTAALHTYLAVSDVRTIGIAGLENVSYIDKLADDALRTQEGAITIGEEVDRIYFDTTADCLLRDPAKAHTVRVAKTGSRSTVVWNPWVAKAQRMGDFGDEEYPEMVCIETTNAGPDIVEIAPGGTHRLGTTLSVE